MLYFVYRVALVLIVVCVFVILVAPDIDLPDSTTLQAKHGTHVVLSSIDLFFAALLMVLITAFTPEGRQEIMSQFDSPSHFSLCTLLC